MRALNHARRESPFSYLGIRAILDQLPAKNWRGWFDSFVERRIATKRLGGYRQFKTLKGIESGQATYRDQMVAGPTAALDESWLLTKISTEREFALPVSAYSYRWPKSRRDGHLFRFFMEGYRKRDLDIGAYTKSHPGSSVFVTDIRNFYPSVDRKIVYSRFEQRITRTGLSVKEKIYANAIVENALATAPKGIPIGPAVGHLLGHLALEEFDSEMSKSFPGTYFRYVDDLVFIIDYRDLAATRVVINDHLTKMGLTLNEGKTELLSDDTWNAHVADVESHGSSDVFAELVDRLRIYLAMYPDRYISIAQDFRSEGFSLPFKRLKAVSGSKRFHFFLSAAFRRKNIGQVWAHLTQDNSALLSLGKLARKLLLRRLDDLERTQAPRHGTARRWFVQECRYLVNRLLYLTDTEGHVRLARFAQTMPELFQSRIVCTALVNRNIDELVKFPSPAISVFSEFSRETGDWPTFEIRLGKSSLPEQIEAAVTCAIAGVGDLKVENLETDFEPDVAKLIKVATRRPIEIDSVGSDPFLEEMITLLACYSSRDLTNLIGTRFSDQEGIGLAAFNLDSGGYAS